MTRLSLFQRSRALVGIAALLCAAGCGGAAAGSEGAGAGSKPGTEEPKDAQAEAARQFCEHDVKAAGLQPPDSLSRKQIVACITALRPKINAECAKSAPREVLLKIVIDRSGAVAEAFPIGDAADSPEAACAAGIVRTAVFPHFKGAPQQVIQKYPLTIGK